jgi:hypothetical protein
MPKVVLLVFGIYSVAVGAFMTVAPGAFFDTLGAFGVRNDHYILDNASFELPLGLLMLAAVRLRSWRVPALAFATAHWALHAVSHLVDTDHAAGNWVGVLEAAGLVFTTVLLAIALRISVSEEKVGVR